MRLPDFITRALGFFDSTEKRLAKLEKEGASCSECAGKGTVEVVRVGADGSVPAPVAEQCDQCGGQGTAKAQLASLNAALTSLDSLLATAQKSFLDAKTVADAKSAEVLTLTEQVATEKRRANETIAAQGLNPAQLPSSEPTAPANPNGENAWAKYNRLLSENPRVAGEFWQQNAEAILEARQKTS